MLSDEQIEALLEVGNPTDEEKRLIRLGFDAAQSVQAQAGAVPLHVDALAQEIRRVDGRHDLGAGALAESLMPFLSAHGIKGGQHEI